MAHQQAGNSGVHLSLAVAERVKGFIQSLFSDSGFRPNSLLTLSFDGIQCLLYLRGVMARAD